MLSHFVIAVKKVTNTLRMAVPFLVALCVEEVTIPEHTQDWGLRISQVFKLVCLFHSKAILGVSGMDQFSTHGVLGSIFKK